MRTRYIILLVLLVSFAGIVGATYLSHNKEASRIIDPIIPNVPKITKPSAVETDGEITRGMTWDNICSEGVCTYIGYTEPINYFDGNEWLPINSTIVESDKEGYDYMVESGLYKVYFKKNISEEKPIEFFYEKPLNKSINVSLWLTPVRLQWRNANDEVEVINRVQDSEGYLTEHIWDTEHHWHNTTDTVFYQDVFGYGTNLTFEYNNLKLKKRVYVNNEIPYPTINLQGITLDVVWKVEISDNARAWVKNNVWNGNTISFNHSVQIKVGNTTMFTLPKAVTKEKFHWENNTPVQNEVTDEYELRMVNGNAYLSVRTSGKFLNNQSLIQPFEIDPSIEVGIFTGWDDAGDVGSVGGGTFNNDSSQYYIATGDSGAITKMGVMFREVMIPQGADITDGYMEVSTWASCPGRGGCNTKANGVNADDVTQWNNGNRPKDATLTTMGSTLYVSGSDTANGVYIPRIYNDSNAIPKTYLYQSVENITNRTNWEIGNNMSFVLQQVSVGFGNTFLVYAYESGNPSATLYVTYTDETNPSVNLSSPSDESTDTDGNITFECNATDNYMVSNLSLFTNFTGSWSYNQYYIPTDMGRGKDADASSSIGGFPPAQAFDGDTGTFWACTDSDLPNWIYVDLGGNYSIYKVKINWFPLYQSSDFYVQLSNDSVTWTNATTTSGNTDYITIHTFTSMQGRYLRVYSVAFGGIYTITAIEEIQIYQKMPYKFYESDISNGGYIWNCRAEDGSSNEGWGASNWTITVSVGGGNTCTYSSGNWEVECSDNCNITDAMDLMGNNLILNGTGTFRINADIINISEIIKGHECEIIKYRGYVLG